MRIKYIVIALIAFGAYVLGARAGRERYEQIADAVSSFWNDPQVKKARGKANKEIQKARKTAEKKAKKIKRNIR